MTTEVRMTKGSLARELRDDPTKGIKTTLDLCKAVEAAGATISMGYADIVMGEVRAKRVRTATVAGSTTAVSAPSESLKAAILRHYRGGTINPQDILSKLVTEGRTLDKVTYIYGVLGEERKAHKESPKAPKAAPKAPKAAPVASEFTAPPQAVKTAIELADPELRLLMEKAVSEHGLNAAEKLLTAMRARANLIQVRVTG